MFEEERFIFRNLLRRHSGDPDAIREVGARLFVISVAIRVKAGFAQNAGVVALGFFSSKDWLARSRRKLDGILVGIAQEIVVTRFRLGSVGGSVTGAPDLVGFD